MVDGVRWLKAILEDWCIGYSPFLCNTKAILEQNIMFYDVVALSLKMCMFNLHSIHDACAKFRDANNVLCNAKV